MHSCLGITRAERPQLAAYSSGDDSKFQYLSNSVVDGVKKFTVESALNPAYERFDNPFPQISTYSANKLYKTITKDENWKSGKNHTTEEFKNNEGQVILKRTYSDIGGQTEVPHDTYYVYDQYGNLTFVIPPLAASEDLTQIVLDDLCYQYRYDYRNRLIEKKLPGKDWEYIVYNTQNMVVATGPAYNPWGENYPSEKGWLITKYDAFGRVVYTGWYTGYGVNSTERAKYQSDQNGIVTLRWKANHEKDFLGYSIYRGDNPKRELSLITSRIMAIGDLGNAPGVALLEFVLAGIALLVAFVSLAARP